MALLQLFDDCQGEGGAAAAAAEVVGGAAGTALLAQPSIRARCAVIFNLRSGLGFTAQLSIWQFGFECTVSFPFQILILLPVVLP